MIKKQIKRNNATIYDVAAIAEVSVGTVSRVFNNSVSVADETRRRVLDVASKLGCRPRTAVRRLQIALITEPPEKTVMGGFVSCVTQHLAFALSRNGLGMMLITEDNLSLLSQGMVDGVIVAAWRPETFDLLSTLNGKPVVVINRCDDTNLFNVVATDHKASGIMVAEQLLSKGHRRMAFVAGSADWGSQARVQGIREAHKIRGLSMDDELMIFREGKPLYQALKFIINRKADCIWLCDEDMAAIEGLQFLQDVMGLRIPEDISVIANENPGITEHLRPSLTALSQPLKELSDCAVHRIMELIEKEQDEAPSTILLDNTLIMRDSVKSRSGY